METLTRSLEVGSIGKSGHRVLALVTDAFGGYGGIAQYNRDFTAALAMSDLVAEVQVLPRLSPDDLGVLPDKLRQSAAIQNRVLYALCAIRNALRMRPTIVFCGHLYHGTLSQLIARLVGAKYISQVHGTEMWGEVEQKYCRALNAADLVLTVSRDTRARVLAATLLEPSEVIVLNNTVGVSFTPGDRAAARKHFGINDEFAILTVARLDAREGYKGHSKVISVLSELNATSRPVAYLIAGIGDDLPRLEALARQYGVADQVRFLGKVPYEDLPDLYRAADLFALPSTGEGFGIAFLEAMACGTPALGLAVGGAPDALGDGELGWCVTDQALPAAFAEAISSTGDHHVDRFNAVSARFGTEIFKQGVSQMISLVN